MTLPMNRPWRRPFGAAAIAGCAAVAVYLILSMGHLPGPVNLALAGLIILVVPTADRFSLRVALNGSMVLGWAPFLWWVRWPVHVDHGAVVVSVGVAAVAFVVASSTNRRAQMSRLVPRCHVVDVLPGASALAALVAMRPWVLATGPRDALMVLLPGIDNVAHYQIFTTMRAYGAVLSQLPPAPGGGSWGFTGYPAGFHSMVASVSELLDPDLAAGPDSLALYTKSVAFVILLGLAVLTSAVVSLPRLHRRPWICAAAVTATTMAFLWSPGQNLFFDGFATFWLGAMASAAAIVLSIHADRRLRILRVLAVVGLLLTVSQTWAPLLVVAAPALLPLLVNVVKPGWRPARRWTWAVLVGFVLLVGLALSRVFDSLNRIASLRTVLISTGGITGTSPLPTFILLVISLYLCCAGGSRLISQSPNAGDRALARSLRALAAVPVLAVVSVAVFLVAQLMVIGTTSYFFLKYFMGIELILAGWVPAVVGIVVASRLPRGRGWRAAVLGITSVLLATQAFAPFPWGTVGARAQPGGTASVDEPQSLTAMADGLVSALGTSTAVQSMHRDYVALGAQRGAQAFYLDAWYHAVFATSSDPVGARLAVLRVKLNDPAVAAPTVRKVLNVDSQVEVVVAPEQVDRLRAALNDEALSRRLVTWIATNDR